MPPVHANNQRGHGGSVKLYPLTCLTNKVAYYHWRTCINTYHVQGKSDQCILTVAYQSPQGDLA